MYCDICSISKQQKLPFNKSSISSIRSLKLLYVDLRGSYKVVSLNGAQYFLTIVDDYNRTTWTYLIANKTLVPSVLSSSITMIENQMQVTIRKIRIDNRSEFLNSSMSTFLQRKFCIKELVFTFHNRMVLWKEKISTYYKLLEFYCSKLIFLSSFGENVYWLQLIWSIDFLHIF